MPIFTLNVSTQLAERQFAWLQQAIQEIKGELRTMDARIQRLIDDVTPLTSAIDGIVALETSNAQAIRDLKQQLEDAIASGQPVDLSPLDAVADAIESGKQKLADAIAANTPAEVPAPEVSEAPADAAPEA